MNKLKDYVRRIKLDHAVKRNMQHARDPMDVGLVQGEWEEYYCQPCGEEGEVDAVGYYGYKGKGK